MTTTTLWLLVIISQGASTTLPVEFASKDACLASYKGAVSSNMSKGFATVGNYTTEGWCVPVDKKGS